VGHLEHLDVLRTMAMDATLVRVHLDPNSPEAQVFYKLGGSSNQSVDTTAPRPSGNITCTNHLCPFNLPTSSLSTILGHDKAIVSLSVMVLVFQILKIANFTYKKKKKKKKKKQKKKTSQSHSLLFTTSLFFPSSIHSPLGFVINILSFSHSPILYS